MREREIRLYHGITEIDETILEEAEGSMGRKPSRWKKWTAAAACLCFTAVMAAVCQRFFIQETETSVNQKAKHDDSDTVDTVPPGKETKYEEDEEAFLYGNSSEITEVPAAPILYSELSWPKGPCAAGRRGRYPGF